MQPNNIILTAVVVVLVLLLGYFAIIQVQNQPAKEAAITEIPDAKEAEKAEETEEAKEAIVPDEIMDGEDVDVHTLEEIALHATAEDCWFAINESVYDVTEFIADAKHPGGKAIVEGCGLDATGLFETRPMGSGTPHSDTARELSKEYYIGELITEGKDLLDTDAKKDAVQMLVQ